jgi:hypothetical protein
VSVKPETRRQRRIRARLLAAVGGYWTKIHVSTFQNQGFPDLLGIVQGLAFAFEVKEPGEPPSEIQVWTMKQMHLHGECCTAVIETPEEAIDLVRNRLKAMGLSNRSGKKSPKAPRVLSLDADGLREILGRPRNSVSPLPPLPGVKGARRLPKNSG